MRASAIATNNQRALAREAAKVGVKVEEYMEQNNMLTDTHLAPWARTAALTDVESRVQSV